ncbi:MAG: MoaD/ThiS family protein [Planctomycetes bacterium]|nr:MoaD/ThiS family protein [Planctomycetota bacterium]
MSATVRIPAPLQKMTAMQSEVECAGATVGACIESLEAKYPGIKAKLCDEQGKVRRYLNLYLNDQDIRMLQSEETPVKSGDHLSIIPAIAGGME